jgi:hypothetical protein
MKSIKTPQQNQIRIEREDSKLVSLIDARRCVPRNETYAN